MTETEVFDALDRAIAQAAPEDLPGLVGRLVEVEERARLRLRMTPATNGDGRGLEPAGEWLTPQEAAALFKVTPRWLNRATRGKTLKFRRQLSGRLVRYEEGGLRRWLASRG